MFDMQLGLALNRTKIDLRIVDFGLVCQISVVEKQSHHYGCLLRPIPVFALPDFHRRQCCRLVVETRHGKLHC